MGSGRDKRKKAKGSQTGQGGLKTAKKTEKNDAKAVRRAEKRAEARTALTLLLISKTSELLSALVDCASTPRIFASLYKSP